MSKYIVQKPVELDKVKVAARKHFHHQLAHNQYIAQPKYDGVAGVLEVGALESLPGVGDVRPSRLRTRTGEMIHSCQHIQQWAEDNLPEGTYFGELWHPTDPQQKISGDVRRQSEQSPGLLFVVYDAVSEEIANWIYEDRLHWLAASIPTRRLLREPFQRVVQSDHVKLPQSAVWPQVVEESRRLKSVGGYDGLILRNRDSIWKEGPATDGAIIKVKPTLTVDVQVLEVVEGKGKFAGSLGSLVVRFKDGRTQDCGGGALTDAERHEIWSNPALIVGKIIEMRGMDWTEDRLLREPRYVSTRFDKVDID